MDYATKILLNNLIDAINRLNDSVEDLTVQAIQDPNWWLFVITVIGVCVTGWFSCVLWKTNKKVGERQVELQRNNIKLQLFDKRYKVYKAIIDAKGFLNRGDHFLNGIYDSDYFDNLGRTFTNHLECLNDAYLESEALFSRDVHNKLKEITTLFAKARLKFFELNKVGYSYIDKLTEEQLNHIRAIVFMNAIDMETIREEIEKIAPHLFDRIPEWTNAVKEFNDYISECGIMRDFDDYLIINSIDR